jgi:hypothetical protein
MVLLLIMGFSFTGTVEGVELVSNGVFRFDTTLTDCYTYQELIESEKGSFSVSIFDLPPDINWKLKGYLECPVPDRAKFKISLKRVNGGLGSGKVSGGRSYLMLSDKERTLFSGSGELSNIELQMKIDELLPKFPESPFDIKVHFRVVIYE